MREAHSGSTTPDGLPAEQATTRARLLMTAAAGLWSLSGLFARAPIFDWPLASKGPLMAFWRAVFAGAVLLPMVRRPRWKWALVPLVLCFTGMNITYLTAMARTTPANAIWLQSAAPFWVFLISVGLWRERVSAKEMVALGFGLSGVGLILCCELVRPVGRDLAGIGCGLISGVFYAGVLLLMRRLRDEDAAWLVALNHAAAAVILLPWVVYVARWPSLPQLAVLAAFGAIQMALPYLLVTLSLRHIGADEAVMIGLVEPVLMPLWAWLVWDWALEAAELVPAWWTLAGGGLILGGLVVRYWLWDSLARPAPAPAECLPGQPQ